MSMGGGPRETFSRARLFLVFLSSCGIVVATRDFVFTSTVPPFLFRADPTGDIRVPWPQGKIN